MKLKVEEEKKNIDQKMNEDIDHSEIENEVKDLVATTLVKKRGRPRKNELLKQLSLVA